MDIAALSAQTGEAGRVLVPIATASPRLASTPQVATGLGEGRVPTPAAAAYARLQARADDSAGLAGGLRSLGASVGEALTRKLYPPYPPEQLAQMRMLAATVEGLKSVDATIATADLGFRNADTPSTQQEPELGLSTQRLLASSASQDGSIGISRNRERLLAIAQGSFAS